MCLDWLRAGKEHNDFAESVMDYPTMELYVSPDDNPSACLPIHAGIVLESLGFGCQNAKDKMAASMDLLQAAIDRAIGLGVKEMIYLSSDERTDEFAVKVLGFHPIKAFRKIL